MIKRRKHNYILTERRKQAMRKLVDNTSKIERLCAIVNPGYCSFDELLESELSHNPEKIIIAASDFEKLSAGSKHLIRCILLGNGELCCHDVGRRKTFNEKRIKDYIRLKFNKKITKTAYDEVKNFINDLDDDCWNHLFEIII